MTLLLEGHDERLLLLGLHAAEHAVALDGLGDGRVVGQRGRVHVRLGPWHAHLRRDARHRARIVSRDHLEVDALLLEVADGLRGRRADLVVDGHESQRFGPPHQIAVLGEALHARQQQHARVGGQPFLLLGHLDERIAQNELTGAHDVALPVRKRRARPLLVGRERDGSDGPQRADAASRIVLDDGKRRVVRIIVRTGDGGERRVHRVLPDALHRTHCLHLHLACGDGARLVKAQRVHACQRLDAVQLLHEHCRFQFQPF